MEGRAVAKEQNEWLVRRKKEREVLLLRNKKKGCLAKMKGRALARKERIAVRNKTAKGCRDVGGRSDFVKKREVDGVKKEREFVRSKREFVR
jgi:hypothetical protein